MNGSTREAARRTSRLAYVAVLLQTLVSAGTYLIAKATLRHIPALTLATCRFLLSSAILLGILAALGRRAVPRRRDLPRILVLGILAIPLNQAFFLAGLQRSVATHAALLYTITPILVLLIAARELGERIRWLELLGILLALAGTVGVLFERGLDLSSGTLHGDLFLMVAVLAWAFYSVEVKPLMRDHGPLVATGWTILAGTILYLPFGVHTLRGFSFHTAPPIVWIGLAYLSVITTVLAYFLWSYALHHLEAARVTVFMNLQPVVTALLAWAILAEPISMKLVLGGALVIAGVWIAQRG